MITVHFVAYLVIILADVATTIPVTDLRSFEISEICNIAFIFVDNVIFGLIINQLASKILAITANTTKTLAHSLMDAAAPSD